MKKSTIFYAVIVIFSVVQTSSAGDISDIDVHFDNSKMTYEDVLKYYCGVKVNEQGTSFLCEFQKILNQEYLDNLKCGKIAKTENVPDWTSMMSPGEHQGASNSCWCHAVTGVTEAMLHIYHGSNIGIDLDELEIQEHYGGFGEPGSLYNAFSYIVNEKAYAESTDQFPNYDNARYSIIWQNLYPTYSIYGIQAIKDALEYGPVTCTMEIFDDYWPFFLANPTGVYWYNGVPDDTTGRHAMVIVSYNEDNPEEPYWIVKDSWYRSGAAGGGYYLKIGMGQCDIDDHAYRAIADTSCFAKITPGLIPDAQTAWSYTWTDGERAYIDTAYSLTANSSLPENKQLECLGTPTILPGKTLTLGANTTLYVANSTYINVYGTLVINEGAVITKVPGGTQWSAIDIETGGTIDVNGNATISNAWNGIRMFGADGVLDVAAGKKLTISDCLQYGIATYGVGPDFSRVWFEDCGDSRFEAALQINLTTGTSNIDNVTILNGGMGVEIMGGVDVELEAFDIRATYNSIKIDSGSSLDIDNNGNNIDPEDGYYAIYQNSSSEDILARNNWWGENPPVPSNLFNYPAKITSTPYLTIPATGAGAPKLAPLMLATDDFESARTYEKNDDWKGAIEVYNTIIATSSDASVLKRAIQRLITAHDRSDKQYNDVRQAILDNTKVFTGQYRPLMDLILCNIMAREGNAEAAITALLKNADKYKDTSAEVQMIAEAAVLSKLYFDDENRAKMYADMAAAINPGQEVLKAAYACADVEYQPEKYIDIYEGAEERFDAGDIVVAERSIAIAPNPFNPATTLSFTLPETLQVKLAVYSITGQKVATLADETMSAGAHSVQFDGAGLASGLYIYRFETPGFSDTGKMLLVK